ncbi:MotA/TolQ/ExbB proton channel family protein [Planctomicrobium sp. SH664]|uniref:MotA/TolQ/ExbB proton channel family protein n=1 Tax=Planctomicrobium sp. SH664 TaxID=3448125 RepID=UPI003F5BFE48
MTSSPRKSRLTGPVDPVLLTSIVLTIIFYVTLHQPAFQGTILHRYTTQHFVEYVIVGLFIWGVMDILVKFAKFPREMLALRLDWLPQRNGREPVSRARELLESIRQRTPAQQNSRIGKRLTRALEYVVEKDSASDYREHLQYLAEQDEDTTHASYTLMRFVIGVTPVLGFLGTVVHFGTALSGISFDELDDRLSMVVGEMGQAFNTTTTALTAAMFTMFALFICERVERRIVQSIDKLVDRELLHRFEAKDANLTPFLSILKSANDDAMQSISAQIQGLSDVWGQAVQSILERFDSRQQHELKQWNEALVSLSQRHEAFDVAREERLNQILSLTDGRHAKFLDHVQSTLGKAIALRDDFSELLHSLNSIARGEGQLRELQSTLTSNLRVIHETQKFDDALHGLTAAIHLLTARHQLPTGNRGSAAA